MALTVALFLMNLVTAQLLVCLLMTGVIWTVQLVIYPLFATFKSNEALVEFHTHYTPKISYVVIPLMFSELGMALAHVVLDFHWRPVVGLALVLGNWLSTFFISVPLHQKIADSGDFSVTHKSAQLLTPTNWPRTILWSLRSVFLYLWASGHLGAL